MSDSGLVAPAAQMNSDISRIGCVATKNTRLMSSRGQSPGMFAGIIRINDITLSAYFDIGKLRRALGVSFYVNNIFLWQANSGVDSNQNFYDFDNSRGLDFFNLPSFKTYGCTVSFKF